MVLYNDKNISKYEFGMDFMIIEVCYQIIEFNLIGFEVMQKLEMIIGGYKMIPEILYK